MATLPLTTSIQVRSRLVEPIELDLVGPRNDHAFVHELLPQSPQRWYLSGYLVPQGADAKDRKTPDAPDEFSAQPCVSSVSANDGAESKHKQVTPGGGSDDNAEAEQHGQVSYLPSSMGLSVLVGPQSTGLSAVVRWGDYVGENEGEVAGEFDPTEVDREHEEEMAKPDELSTAEAEGGWPNRKPNTNPPESAPVADTAASPAKNP